MEIKEAGFRWEKLAVLRVHPIIEGPVEECRLEGDDPQCIRSLHPPDGFVPFPYLKEEFCLASPISLTDLRDDVATVAIPLCPREFDILRMGPDKRRSRTCPSPLEKPLLRDVFRIPELLSDHPTLTGKILYSLRYNHDGESGFPRGTGQVVEVCPPQGFVGEDEEGARGQFAQVARMSRHLSVESSSERSA